jgi:hypothetical protein
MFRKNQIVEKNQLKMLIQAIDGLSNVILNHSLNTQYTPDIESKTEYVNVINPINEELQSQVELLQIQLDSIKQERDCLLEKINNNEQFISDEALRNRYIQLLDFTFKNIDPFTNIDIIQAKSYYENIIKK